MRRTVTSTSQGPNDGAPVFFAYPLSMGVLRSALCRLAGGHRWVTTTDAVGDLTRCSRCGALRHQRAVSRERDEPVRDYGAARGGEGPPGE